MNIFLLAAGIFCIATGFLLPLGIALVLVALYFDVKPRIIPNKEEKTYKMDEYSSNVSNASV
jgi:hypothetical protein|tara:strand:+ start:253 stop:438 length:186 start_codon:yes stop_codon:yes gene_type:complete